MPRTNMDVCYEQNIFLVAEHTVGSLWRDPPVEIRRPFVRPQLQYHLPAQSAGRDLKQPFVSHRSLLSGGDKQKIQGVNKIEI